jgi:hypothetical protein
MHLLAGWRLTGSPVIGRWPMTQWNMLKCTKRIVCRSFEIIQLTINISSDGNSMPAVFLNYDFA